MNPNDEALHSPAESNELAVRESEIASLPGVVAELGELRINPAECWLTVAQAARRMHCCPRTLRDRIYSGELQAFNPAGKLLIKAADVDALVEKHPR